MRTSVISPLLLSTLALAAPAVDTSVDAAAACDKVHIFVARGTGEPYPGRQGSLVDSVCGKLSGTSCGYEDVQYPATDSPDYCASAHAGVKAAKQQIKDYVGRCPNAKVVLTGYSQGAHLLGDALGGGGGQSTIGCYQQETEPLDQDKKASKAIKAVTFFGDARHTANQAYNVEDGSGLNGLWPRGGNQLTDLNHYSKKLRSWCLAADPVCANGWDGNMHTVYLDWYTEDAANFIVNKL